MVECGTTHSNIWPTSTRNTERTASPGKARSKVKSKSLFAGFPIFWKLLFWFWFFFFMKLSLYFFFITKIQLSQCNLMGCCPVNPAWQKLQLNSSSSKGVSSPLRHSIHLSEWWQFPTCSGHFNVQPVVVKHIFFLNLNRIRK